MLLWYCAVSASTCVCVCVWTVAPNSWIFRYTQAPPIHSKRVNRYELSTCQFYIWHRVERTHTHTQTPRKHSINACAQTCLSETRSQVSRLARPHLPSVWVPLLIYHEDVASTACCIRATEFYHLSDWIRDFMLTNSNPMCLVYGWDYFWCALVRCSAVRRRGCREHLSRTYCSFVFLFSSSCFLSFRFSQFASALCLFSSFGVNVCAVRLVFHFYMIPSIIARYKTIL